MTEQKSHQAVANSDLWQYVAEHKPQIENSLRRYLPLAPPNIETKFNEAAEYALFSGGKRLRPVLTLLGAELVGGKSSSIFVPACAVEFIHTSSLIFDDLPCMDNAGERRGKTSLHEKYDDGLAILVAIGFLNAAYHLVFVNHREMPELAIRAHTEIVECVGAAGMIGGQSIDLALAKDAVSNKVSSNDDEFESNRNLKTSALMRLALRVGAILAGASETELIKLSFFAKLLGEAYQLSDDLIDLDEDGEIFTLNKPFAVNLGKVEAESKLQKIVAAAKTVLFENFPASNARNCLMQLTDYLVERKN